MPSQDKINTFAVLGQKLIIIASEVGKCYDEVTFVIFPQSLSHLIATRNEILVVYIVQIDAVQCGYPVDLCQTHESEAEAVFLDHMGIFSSCQRRPIRSV